MECGFEIEAKLRVSPNMATKFAERSVRSSLKNVRQHFEDGWQSLVEMATSCPLSQLTDAVQAAFADTSFDDVVSVLGAPTVS